jgi:hypothetical protein
MCLVVRQLQRAEHAAAAVAGLVVVCHRVSGVRGRGGCLHDVCDNDVGGG